MMTDIIEQLEDAMDDPGDTGWAQPMRVSLVEQAIAELGRLRVIEADKIRQYRDQETLNDSDGTTPIMDPNEKTELAETDATETLTRHVMNIYNQHQRAIGALQSTMQILLPGLPKPIDPPENTIGLLDGLRDAANLARDIADRAESLRDSL